MSSSVMPLSAILELPEQELNALLRRADWRFLLPSPRPRRALCRAVGILAKAVASIAEETITDGRDCDLAVAEDPERRTLVELLDALRPGGLCYTEWHPRIGGVGRIERELRAAGFADVTCYRLWPASTGLPVYWTPIGAAGAAGYVRSRRWLRGGRVRRLLAAPRNWVRNTLGMRYSGLICAIARRPGESQSYGLDPAQWLHQRWSEWGLGASPERLSTLLVTGGPRSVSKVVLLAFAEPSQVPLVAVKAPRVDDAARGILREGAALASLNERRSKPVPGAPRLLFRREIDAVPMVGETALAGRPLDSLLTRRSLATWSVKVTDWLATLAQGPPAYPASHWRNAVVEPVLSQFLDRFEAVADPGLVRESEALVRAIGSLPPVPEQRDFGPWNLLVGSSGELAVLDWESAEVEGLPALDLLYYLAYASFKVDGASDRESRIASYRRSLDRANLTGAVRQECLDRYFESLGLEPARLAPLRVLVWLIHAHSDFRHAAADLAGPPTVEALRRSLFLALWAEEVRHLARG